MTMADSIAVMRDGRVQQLGGPVELYERPNSAFVANFLGQSNLLRGRVTDRSGQMAPVTVGDRSVAVARADLPEGAEDIDIGVRPEKLAIAATLDEVPAGANTLPGTLIDSSFTGVSIQHTVRLPWGQEIAVFAQNRGGRADVERGSQVVVHWEPAHTFAVPIDETSPGTEDAASDVWTGATGR